MSEIGKTTPGPWTENSQPWSCGSRVIFGSENEAVAIVYKQRDAALIVKAVNGFPALIEALRRLAGDVLDYERINNLAPNPSRNYCWDSTKNAVELLMSLGIDTLPISTDPQARSSLGEARVSDAQGER